MHSNVYLSHVTHDSNAAYDCLGRVYTKFRLPECVDSQGEFGLDDRYKKFRNQKDCELIEGRFWVWGRPIMGESDSLTSREVIDTGLLN